jgi:hypothetical protein
MRRTLSEEREARIKSRVEAEMSRLPLAEVRSNMYLSTLRSYVEAMGGHLDVRAVFPDGDVVLEHLTDSGEEKIAEEVHAYAS